MEPPQEIPPNERVFEFRESRSRGSIIVHVNGPFGRGAVAEIFAARGRFPLLRIQYPLGVSTVMAICELVKARKHLELTGE